MNIPVFDERVTCIMETDEKPKLLQYERVC